MINRYFVLLNTADNVFVCCKEVLAGSTLVLEDVEIKMTTDITVGHKIARQAISSGDKILKYGVSIGSATQDIAVGEHVHIQNMKSDYIASHTRQNKVGDIV